MIEATSKNFSALELRCRCKKCNLAKPHGISQARLDKLQEFRTEYGMPVTPNSAYRCAEHPIESAKPKPGQHHYGAIDVSYTNAHDLGLIVSSALYVGLKGIGIYDTFVHVDTRDMPLTMWRGK